MSQKPVLSRQAPVDEFPSGLVPVRPGHTRSRGPVLAWERRYRLLVIGCDVLTVSLVSLLATASAGVGLPPTRPWQILATAVIVLLAIAARRGWSRGVLGEGAEEFRRLGNGMGTAAVVIALLGSALEDLRTWPTLFVFLPLGTGVALGARYLLRRLLHRARHRGACLLPVVVAGAPDSVRDLIRRTREQPYVGWRVEAACLVPSGDEPFDAGEIDGVPVVAGLDGLGAHVLRAGYRVVAVTSAPYWTTDRLQRLAWELEGTSAELTVAPVLMEVGGPRLRVSGVLGMPMLRVRPPMFTGGHRVVKEIVDRLGALFALTLALPLMLTIAAAIKLGDRGPVFYTQHRVSRDGQLFRMWKFRTMRVGADAERAGLAELDAGSGPLFKVYRDPRITRTGALLRRFSLDELPQLLNVLGGTMSLVGPRPPLPEETESYGTVVRRRLLVKPGMTGLWQVSGRSDLSWEDSVRLDLRYVEDWSLALDAAILWKTARAVVGGRGAY
ncbi:exopolysaccharide biosynthesis polyprenyl glycosylphosphotransferase [Amycolatopsis antarctica]|uniref:Exopolysaccharide biosynthesis polyprenyl glycosylphosphotransferase n=1 Tax=Amycolatopsis antarctica TaxID=1854586 RepID=A0A263CW29_9PSEU|nr:sugar transferase [Amycolatopsis antarctica]OZM70344.1 exopolysaccharide biosynthesis polyprenyl glycosylphosphotransferase [Amycolatopsis antarctica]